MKKLRRNRQIGAACGLHRRIGRSRSLPSGTICLAAICCACVGSARGGDDTDALLDECIAGIDANVALIEHGTARYRLASSRGTASAPDETTLTVVFENRRYWFQRRWEQVIDGEPRAVARHTIIDGDECIEYYPALDGHRLPNANIVIIVPSPRGRSAFMEPRQQRNVPWGDPPPFAWEIGYMRRTAREHLTARVDADGLIEISLRAPADKKRGTYWLAPQQGYALLSAREWDPGWAGAEPSIAYDAEFRQANNGAFVVSHRRERACRVDNGALVPWFEGEIWLEEIDLVTRPPDESFTLEALDPPIGAPIHDRLHGRELRYGIDAIDEDGISVGAATGPLGLMRWLRLFNFAVGAAFLLWFGNRLARWYDRRFARVRP